MISVLAIVTAFAGPAIGDEKPVPRNDYYRRILYAMPISLDPVKGTSGNEVQVIRQLFDQLVAYDKDYRWKPMLAESWSVSDNGRKYAFRIRKGVRFVDGSELTPDDVVFSLQRMIRGSDQVRQFNDISGIKAEGDTVIVETRQSTPYLLHILAGSAASIIKKGYGGSPEEAPTGTGPFTLECRNDNSLILKANPDYFMSPPKLPGIVYFIYPDKERLFEDFVKGELDDIAPYNLPKGADRSGFKRIFTNGIISFIFTLNASNPPLDNKYVRQALARAIDYDRVLDGLSSEFPLLGRSASYIPKGRVGYDPGFKGTAYDPAEALRLIRKAGYKEFKDVPPIKLQFTGNIPYTGPLLDGLAAYAAKSGLRIIPEKTDNSGIAANFKSGLWHMTLLGSDWPFMDSYFLLSAYRSDSGKKMFSQADKELDTLLDKCRTEMNPSRRTSLFRMVNDMLIEKAYIIPLYSGDIFDGTVQKWVEGVQYPNTSFNDIEMYHVSIAGGGKDSRPSRAVFCGR
ncbi:MAG: ABC transporter substrate-binding protein [Elusimicrobiales bacterium]|jgi:ABC-type transport system substrate-binding protein|nr:ABC transporter substrate-binding protein [Elusimicrobiales bacterium]